jgi:magnesium-transporting ATPase (P-type)
MPNAESSDASDWPEPSTNPAASAAPGSAPPPHPETDHFVGLSEAEAQRRWAAGLGNDAPLQSSRSYAQIVRVNLFAFINFVFFGIGVVMVALGRAGDAILVTVAIGSGVALNIIQEIAAKRKLDRIALLTRPTATVVRSRQERMIDPAQIVQGDLLRVRSGDQILVDGTVAGTGFMTVDESLLTGESDPVPKVAGDRLYSGTVCTSGTAAMVAEQVGRHSVAYRLAQSARQFRQMYTPLQGEINLVIRIFTLLACFLWILVGISVLSRIESLEESVQRAAVIAGLVPSGLYLTITLSYALGAVKMVGEQVLIQQVNAVESLSNVDVLCLDKTGTLTANRMRLEQVVPLGGNLDGNWDHADSCPDRPIALTPDQLRDRLATIARSTQAPNATSEAIAAAGGGAVRSPLYEIPFASVRKWSAIAFAGSDAIAPSSSELIGTEPIQSEPSQLELIGTEPIKPEPIKPEPSQLELIGTEPIKPEPIKPEPIKPEPIKPEPIKPEPIKPEPIKPEPIKPEREDWGGLYVLGAPEMVLPQVGRSLSAAEQEPWQQATRQGLRVLLLAHCATVPPPPPLDQPSLPNQLQPLAWVILSDELRPQVRETLAGFAAAGIAVKVISGDSPATVAAVATQAGLGDRPTTLAGTHLDEMSDVELVAAVTQTTVFGRVTPTQKERLVGALRDRGHYVAMIGDGVNDVLSLKRANLGIAMESGSKATRSAADIVLLGDSFTALPLTFLEGQRIRNAIRDVLKLFLVRVFCVTILILCTGQVLGTFPMQNKHSAIVTILGVGMPTFGFPIWAKPGKSGDRGVLRSILHFTVPATLSLSLVALAVYFSALVTTIQTLSEQSGGYVTLDANTLATPRSALVTVLLMGQLMLVPFLKPPTRAWVGGEPLSGDWRYTLVAAGLMVAYFGVLLVPESRNFFELVWLGWGQYGAIALVSVGWAMVLRYSWRSRLIDRFLGVNLSGQSRTGG